MSEFLAAYGLFLAELATFALVLVILVIVIIASRRRGHAEGLVVEHLNRQFEDSADGLKLAIEGKGRHKKALKARQKERKREERIRHHAHRIWEEEGRPHGRDGQHWQMAKDLVAIEEGYESALKPAKEKNEGE